MSQNIWVVVDETTRFYLIANKAKVCLQKKIVRVITTCKILWLKNIGNGS